MNQFRPARHEKDSNLRLATRPANLSGKELPLPCVINAHLLCEGSRNAGIRVCVRSTLTVKH
ncbi:hypothetical protein HaLaN_14408, partial [Haematococcus lacustris]